MRQISLIDTTQVDQAFPGHRRCAYLELTGESATMMGEAFILGRCRLFGDRAIEQGCASCPRYGQEIL